MLKPFTLRSNWEIVAFYLIRPFVSEKRRQFSRQTIMRGLGDIIPMLTLFGHKKNPNHPEETLQRTLQNMRDKKWLIMHGGGQYELTEEGYKILHSIEEHLDSIKGASKEITALKYTSK